MMRWFGSVLLLLAVAVPALAIDAPALAPAAERFLPPDGNNVSAAHGLLRRWPAGGPRELWRAALGYGKSAIAEVDGHAYTLTQLDKKQYAICLDPANGKVLWQHLLVPKGNSHCVNGPVSSPLVDGDRMYAFPYDSLHGDLWEPRCPCFCLRTTDGSVVWQENAAFNCSEGSTPLIVGEVLYIGGGGGHDAALAAVDKRTGKLLSKTPEERDTLSPHQYVTGSSLTYQEVGGIPQIIVSVYTNDLMGVHASTGKVLWHWTIPHPTHSGMLPTPVAMGSRVLISASQSGLDYAACLDMAAHDGTITPRVVYESRTLQCAQFHTPSIYQGAVYGFGKGREHDALQCTNFEDGQLLWQQETPDWTRDRQLVIADGLIFAITKQQELVLAEASRTGYKELGRVNPGMKLGLPQQPMLFGDHLYLRGDDTVVCYRIGAEKP